MELSRSYNINNNVGITKGEREWYLNYDGDFEALVKTNEGLLKSVDRTIFGQIANGDRIVLFRNGKRIGVCATILSGSNDKCFCYTYPEHNEVFVSTQSGNLLGTLDITEAFDNYKGFVDEIYIVPLSTTTVNTQINFSIDGNGVGNVTVANGTRGGSLIALNGGTRYISEKLEARRNAATDDRSGCILFFVCRRNKKQYSDVILKRGDELMCVTTEDIGNFSNIFRFNEFVRVKGFAIVPLEQNVNDVVFKVRSIAGVDIVGDVMTLPNVSPVGIPVYGCTLNYITKSVDFRVTAGVVSATKARVYVIYEKIGNRVHYSYTIHDANTTTTRFICNDVFDATISKAIFDARTLADMDKGNFSITLTQSAGAIASNVDCYRSQVAPVLVNAALVPATTIGMTNVATGGATDSVTVSLDLFLQ